jgi:hypothetical protein
VSIQWGAWGGGGMVANNAAVLARMQRQGIAVVLPLAGLGAMETLLAAQRVPQVLMPCSAGLSVCLSALAPVVGSQASCATWRYCACLSVRACTSCWVSGQSCRMEALRLLVLELLQGELGPPCCGEGCPALEPIGYNWFYLTCRIGWLVPICQSCLGSLPHQRKPDARTLFEGPQHLSDCLAGCRHPLLVGRVPERPAAPRGRLLCQLCGGFPTAAYPAGGSPDAACGRACYGSHRTRSINRR